MRRLLLSLISLLPLLLSTMAIGPCDSQPLGSVERDGASNDASGSPDGGLHPGSDAAGGSCTFGGATYPVGTTFPSDQGCNTCTCIGADKLACTAVACHDAGVPERDGGSGACVYDGVSYPVGATFPSGDGCNNCSCEAGGGVACTEIACVNDGGTQPGRDGGSPSCFYDGAQYPGGTSFPVDCNTCICQTDGQVICTKRACTIDAGRDAPGTCTYGGVTYMQGTTFADGCNSCTCGAGGQVACTAVDCRDAGGDARPRACTPGQDHTCNDDPTMSSLAGTCQADGTCVCRANLGKNPLTGRCLATTAADGGATGGCSYGGAFYPVGASYRAADGCNSCTCTSTGESACTKINCGTQDGGTPMGSCEFDAVYIYGDTGGFSAYENRITLSPPASYLYNRIPLEAGMAGISCSPALPACNSPGTNDVWDITLLIHDPDIQRLLATKTTPPMLFGYDARPVDGTVFSFARGDGHSFLVGGDCRAGDTACVPVPASVARLVAALRALDQQQLADASCASLRR